MRIQLITITISFSSSNHQSQTSHTILAFTKPNKPTSHKISNQQPKKMFTLKSTTAALLTAILGLTTAAPTTTTTTRSTSSYSVKNFDYHADYIFSTPSHQNSWGYVTFSIDGLATPAVQCATAANRIPDFFYGDVSYVCSDPAYSFRFDRPSNTLGLTGPEGTGEVVGLGLQCTETLEENGDWQVGEVYSWRKVGCGFVDVVVPVA